MTTNTIIMHKVGYAETSMLSNMACSALNSNSKNVEDKDRLICTTPQNDKTFNACRMQ